MSDFNKIKHLYWRFGFGLNPVEYSRLKKRSLQQAADDLWKESATFKPFESEDKEEGEAMMDEAAPTKSENPEKFIEKVTKDRKKARMTSSVWVRRMADPTHGSLREKMAMFWHGHFACSSISQLEAVNYTNTLLKHSLGNFKEFVLAIAKEPSMIRYLNNQQNFKEKPNENFARELMELFTLGQGNYTETDIKEAARAFTGWGADREGKFMFRERKHDFGSKTFMGQTGNFNGEDIINIILEKRAAADFITRKFYRYFVSENIDNKIVEQLSKAFYDSGYDIGTLVKNTIGSSWFYEPKNMGDRIKSPIELVVGIMRATGLNVLEDSQLLLVQRGLGQMLHFPPSVAGWPGGRAWVNNSSLLVRLNLGAMLFLNSDLDVHVKGDLESEQGRIPIRRFQATVALEPIKKMLASEPADRRLELLADFVAQSRNLPDLESIKSFSADAPDDETRLVRWVVGLMSTPEYQVC